MLSLRKLGFTRRQTRHLAGKGLKEQQHMNSQLALRNPSQDLFSHFSHGCGAFSRAGESELIRYFQISCTSHLQKTSAVSIELIRTTNLLHNYSDLLIFQCHTYTASLFLILCVPTIYPAEQAPMPSQPEYHDFLQTSLLRSILCIHRSSVCVDPRS